MNERSGKSLNGEESTIAWDGDRIVEVSPHGFRSGVYLSPGWLDIQINGLIGVNFGDPKLEISDVRRIAEKLWADGTTHFLPTLITDDLTRMESALRRLAAARREPDLDLSILGFHLEGPWLSPEDGPRGAHPKDHCRLPKWEDFERLQAAADGGVKLVTLAPELEGAIPFVRQLVESGVKVAIGHTAASREQILAAVDAGATLATHLGNAAHQQIDRHRNYIFDQLGEDRLYASLIVDGHHLPPHVVQSFVRAKEWHRVILVSDAVALAGMPPGIYDVGYRKFEVRDDGYVGVYGEPRMAGSGIMLKRGVENVMRFTEDNLRQAIWMVTSNPWRFLGFEEYCWMLAGQEATFLRLHFDAESKNITILETVLAGKVVYQRPGESL